MSSGEAVFKDTVARNLVCLEAEAVRDRLDGQILCDLRCAILALSPKPKTLHPKTSCQGLARGMQDFVHPQLFRAPSIQLLSSWVGTLDTFGVLIFPLE